MRHYTDDVRQGAARRFILYTGLYLSVCVSVYLPFLYMYKQIRVETWILTARFCVSLVLFWLYNKNCDRAVKQSIGRGEKKRKTNPSSTRRAESSSQLQHSREQCSLKWFYYICCIFRERVRACVHWGSSRLCGVVDAPKDQRQYNLQVATTPINCTRRRRRRREFTIVVGDIIVRVALN